MKQAKQVYVEINPENGKIIRIFKNIYDALQFDQQLIQTSRKEAVGQIREQIVERSKIKGQISCEDCSCRLNESTGHMHETEFKGSGGEVSLANGIFLCPRCHLQGRHGDRNWQSGKL